MTTPPTPAGWYPDPEHENQLRYWDGAVWTEHRSPAQGPPAPEAQEPSVEQVPPPAAGGAHRAQELDPEPLSTTEQPTTEVPLREWSFEPPPLEPEATPEATWAHEPASTPEPESAQESTPQPSPLSMTEQPTTTVPPQDWTSEPTPEPAPYADATTPTPPEPPAVEPPAGTEPRQPVDNRKLIVGFGGAIAGLLLLLVLAAVYAFVIHKPDRADLTSPTTVTSTTTTKVAPTPDETTGAEAPVPPPAAGATDGPLTFAVTGVESGATVTDPENEFLTKDAQGEFVVVRLTVQNTSPDPGQFLGTFQKLNAGGQAYTIDDEATFYVGGGFVDIPPGGEVQVGLAYDVPPGTVPESVELHADPMSPGVVLPVG
jgi:Domain of unknown function (DUF4352)/Protein of unknown function (DUF2510)